MYDARQTYLRLRGQNGGMGNSKPNGHDGQERREQIDTILEELRCHMDQLMALCSDAADLAPDNNVPDVASAKRTASSAQSGAIGIARAR